MLDSNASLLDLVLWAGAIALGAGLGWRLGAIVAAIASWVWMKIGRARSRA